MNLFNDKIKFIHYRSFGADGRPTSRGGHTVAYYKEPDGLIRAADAHCSRKDNFCYATGRMVAVQRLKQEGEYFVANMTPKKFREEIDASITSRLGLSRVFSRKRKSVRLSERVSREEHHEGAMNDEVEMG